MLESQTRSCPEDGYQWMVASGSKDELDIGKTHRRVTQCKTVAKPSDPRRKTKSNSEHGAKQLRSRHLHKKFFSHHTIYTLPYTT
jgi:hypothetical protein